jgi:hypothetical protein
MHQGFLSNREGGQGVTGANESTKNPHGGTVHHGGEQFEIQNLRNFPSRCLKMQMETIDLNSFWFT